MSVAASIHTAEQLFEAGDLGRCELVHGELVMMSPAGYPHGRLTARLAKLIAIFVDEQQIGEVLGAETGFIISRTPDTVRAPDVAFVAKDRAKDAPDRGFFVGAPDLAVEVLSPDDTAPEVLEKTQDWSAAGTTAVWIVDPKRKTLAVHRSDGPVKVYRENEIMPGESPLIGLRLPMQDVFS